MKGVEVPVVTGFIRAATQVWWEEQMEIFLLVMQFGSLIGR